MTKARVRFVGEQDGPPERELKRALAELCQRSRRVTRAYLARTEYDRPGVHHVALCLRTPGGDHHRELVEEIGASFATSFGADRHLDVLFLSESQEHELRAVCRPFFPAGPAR